MTAKELDKWAADSQRFYACFADVSGRKEPSEQAIVSKLLFPHASKVVPAGAALGGSITVA
jgi:hypothetical protein